MRKPLRSSTFCFFTRVVVSDDQGIEEWSNEVTADMAHALRGEAVAVGRAIAKLRAVAHQVAVAALEMVRTRIESGAYLERGGVAYTRSLLGAAVATGGTRTGHHSAG